MTNNKGFTLIELMVVIAIIGILTSIGLVSFSGARAKANDAKRRADLKTLQTALEGYYNDNNAYPSTAGSWYSSETDERGSVARRGGDWIPGLAPKYLKQLPKDPAGGQGLSSLTPGCPNWNKSYLYLSTDGSEYTLLSHCSIEATPLNNQKDALYDPTRPTWAWKVCSGQTGCSI